MASSFLYCSRSRDIASHLSSVHLFPYLVANIHFAFGPGVNFVNQAKAPLLASSELLLAIDATLRRTLHGFLNAVFVAYVQLSPDPREV